MPHPLTTYSFIVSGGPAPICRVIQVSGDVSAYFEAHVRHLLLRAANGSTAPARFHAASARDRFEHLKGDNPDAFITAAQALANSLHSNMDHRAQPGFFVALRQTVDDVLRAAVLKLDIRDQLAAKKVLTPAGDPQLEAVKDLLDFPGKLQKGAVYPDDRRQSDVVVGDKMELETAQYFLRAIEARQVTPPDRAGKRVLDAVRMVAPGSVKRVASELAKQGGAISVPDFLSHCNGILDPTEQEGIIDRLERSPRAVETLNPATRPPRAVITADGIVIQGTVAEIERKVHWQRRAGGWRVTVDVASEPIEEFQ